MAMSANAQWFDFKNNVHRYEIGLNLGVPGVNTEFHDFGIVASFSAWGVYIDFLKAGPKYKYDNHVADMTNPAAMVPDSTAWTLNFGGGLIISPIRWMSIYGIYTKHAIYGGLTFNLSAIAQDQD